MTSRRPGDVGHAEEPRRSEEPVTADQLATTDEPAARLLLATPGGRDQPAAGSQRRSHFGGRAFIAPRGSCPSTVSAASGRELVRALARARARAAARRG